jgi:hypothetical protein
MYWVKDAEAAALRQTVEAEIARLIGRPATIQLQPRVNHRPDSTGIGVQMGVSVLFVLVMVGLLPVFLSLMTPLIPVAVGASQGANGRSQQMADAQPGDEVDAPFTVIRPHGCPP